MMIYQLYDNSFVEDWIQIDLSELEEIENPCMKSQFHLLSKEELHLKTSLQGGLDFPDYLCPCNVPLFSERLYQKLQPHLQRNIFVRDVKITCEVTEKTEPYRIVLPMMLDCVYFEKSKFESLWEEKIVVHENLLGNAMLFKLAGISNHGLFFREPLKEIFASPEFVGYEFYEI